MTDFPSQYSACLLYTSVATSDGMEQVIILGHGALRVSARMFHEEVQDVEKEIRRCIQGEA